MRVALLHNASAGSEDHDAVQLSQLLRRAGHRVVHRLTRVGDLTAALQDAPCDLVVVAGGDGTVGRAACELAGWQVPLSIIPLGTANNTARTLRLERRHKQLAKSWHDAAAVAFDLGVLSDGSVRQRFAEAVGWGVFALAIVEAKRRKSSKTVDETLKRDRKLFRAMTRAAPARHYAIELDGRDLSGDYILVEAMNVPWLGPRLAISPTSDPGDGQFELVLVSENERPALEHLATPRSDNKITPLRVERGARLRVETSETVLHCDGRLWRHPPGQRRFELELEPHAVRYLR